MHGSRVVFTRRAGNGLNISAAVALWANNKGGVHVKQNSALMIPCSCIGVNYRYNTNLTKCLESITININRSLIKGV